MRYGQMAMDWMRTAGSARRKLALVLSLAVGAATASSAWGAGSPIQVSSVAAGSAVISHNGANTVIKAADRTIINYRQLDLPAGSSLTFVQPSSTSTVLNRINSVMPSQLNGTITANGIVYFSNPSGIVFGPNSVVNAGQIIAGAGSISDASFLKGITQFSNTNGAVVNQGSITAGSVSLIGARVSNVGSIVTPASGMVTMAAGADVYVGQANTTGGSGILVKVTGTADPAASSLVSSGSGDIYAAFAAHQGGTIKSGTVNIAAGKGAVAVTGTIDASSKTGTGGTVNVTGQQVLLSGATINASGATGGGTVNIGGNEHGSGPLQNASLTFIDKTSSVNASAIGSGNGGNVVAWSDQNTVFAGNIAVAGGAVGGNGGHVEVSSKGTLNFTGTVNTLAAVGTAGTLLLDPSTLTITDTLTGSGDQDPTIVANSGTIYSGGPNIGGNTISWGTIESIAGNVQLTATGLVTINSAAAGVASGTPHLINLPLQTAGRQINITSTTGDVVFADPADTLRTEGGSVFIFAGGAITVSSINTTGASGSVSGGGVVLGAGSVTPGSLVTINGAIATKGNASSGGVLIFADALSLHASGGTITATGSGVDIGPQTSGTALNVGGGTGLDVAASDISAISTTTLTLGSATTGTLTVKTNLSALTEDLILKSPAGIALSMTGASPLIRDAGHNLTFDGPVTLSPGTATANTTVDTLGVGVVGGNITFTGTVDAVSSGVQRLTLEAGPATGTGGGVWGNISFQGNVGQLVPVGIVNITAANDLSFQKLTCKSAQFGPTGYAVQDQVTFNDAVSLTGPATGVLLGITSNKSEFVPGATLTGLAVKPIQISNSGLMTIDAAFNLAGDFTQTGAGTVNLSANISASGRAITFQSPVTLKGTGVAFDTTTSGANGGNITFNNTLLNGNVGTAATLDLTAGSGQVWFNGAVGTAPAPLGAITVHSASGTSSAGVTFAATTYASSISITTASTSVAAGGVVLVQGAVTAPGGFSSSGTVFENDAAITTTNTPITITHNTVAPTGPATATVTINGLLSSGSGSSYGDITITGQGIKSTSAGTIDGGNVTLHSADTSHNPVGDVNLIGVIAATHALTSTGVNFINTSIDSGQTITINHTGDVTVSANLEAFLTPPGTGTPDVAITGATILATGPEFRGYGVSLTSTTGAITLNSPVFSLGYALTANSAAAFTSSDSLSTGGGAASITAAGLATFNGSLVAGTGAVGIDAVGITTNAGGTLSGNLITLTGHAGDVTLADVVTANGGLSSTGKNFTTSGNGTITTASNNPVNVLQSGNVIIGAAINTGSGSVTLTGSGAGSSVAVNSFIHGGLVSLVAGTLGGGYGPITVTAPITAATGFSSTGSTFDNTGGTINTTNGPIQITQSGAVTIGSAINSGLGSITISGSSITNVDPPANIGTITGGDITLTSTGDVNVNAAILGSGAFNSTGVNFDSNSAGTITLTGTNKSLTVLHSGTVTIGGAIDVSSGSVNLTSGGGQALAVNAPIHGAMVTLVAGSTNTGFGPITVTQHITGDMGFLSTGSTFDSTGGPITVNGWPMVLTQSGAVTLGADLSVGTGDPTFHVLTINAGGDITQTAGTVTGAVLHLVGTSSGAGINVLLNRTDVSTLTASGLQSLNLTNIDPLTLSNTSTTGSTSVSALGTLTVGGTVQTSYGKVTLTASQIDLADGSAIHAGGNAEFNGPVTVTGSAGVIANTTTFDSTVDGSGSNSALTVSTNTVIVSSPLIVGAPIAQHIAIFDGNVGGTTPLGTLTVNEASKIGGNISAGTVSLQTVTLTANSVMTVGSMTVGTIDSDSTARTLTITGTNPVTTGQPYSVTFDNVGASSPLSAFTLNAPAASFVGSSINVSSTVVVNGDLVINSVGTPPLATINGRFLRLTGAITSPTPATSLTLNGQAILTNEAITITGDVLINGILSNMTSSSINSTNFDLVGTLSTRGALAIKASNTALVQGNILGTGTMSIEGDGTGAGPQVHVTGSIVSGTAAHDFAATFISTAPHGLIEFGGTIGGANQPLAGDIGILTGSGPLASLTVNTAGLALFDAAVGSVTTTGLIHFVYPSSQIPTGATIASPGSLTLNAGNVTFDAGSKLTVQGNISILTPTATGIVLLGDLNASGNIVVTGSAIGFQTRSPGQVYLAHGSLVTDSGVDLVAGGTISFSAVPTVLNPSVSSVVTAATSLGLASDDLTGKLIAASITIQKYGPLAASDLVPAAGTSGLPLYLDLVAPPAQPLASQNNHLAESISVGSPNLSTLPTISDPIVPGPTVDALRQLGLFARWLNTSELQHGLGGYTFIDDSNTFSVTVNRLTAEELLPVVQSYQEIFFGLKLDADGQIVRDASGHVVLDPALKRDDVIQKIFETAWKAYAAQNQGADPAGFRAFLVESKSREALLYLEKIHKLLAEIQDLGLTGHEFTAAEAALLHRIKPSELTDAQFAQAIMSEEKTTAQK